ncbi:MAG TPA: GWxTD domain-containing protein [Bacteroidetes bacterium]|nr:GWxTD domain-containing protein [Bacteroidota bacterium]
MPGTTIYSDQIKLNELEHGEYLLEIFLYRDEALIAEVSRKFIIDWKYLREIFGDLDTAISKMQYATSFEQINRLKTIQDPDEKLKQFLQFWRLRSDPSHDNDMEALESYYDRIYYAEEHFEEDKPGWKTDRGRIYALYGAPDRQSSFRAAEVFYEVWTYRKWGLRFLFRADNAGNMNAIQLGGG